MFDHEKRSSRAVVDGTREREKSKLILASVMSLYGSSPRIVLAGDRVFSSKEREREQVFGSHCRFTGSHVESRLPVFDRRMMGWGSSLQGSQAETIQFAALFFVRVSVSARKICPDIYQHCHFQEAIKVVSGVIEAFEPPERVATRVPAPRKLHCWAPIGTMGNFHPPPEGHARNMAVSSGG